MSDTKNINKLEFGVVSAEKLDNMAVKEMNDTPGVFSIRG